MRRKEAEKLVEEKRAAAQHQDHDHDHDQDEGRIQDQDHQVRLCIYRTVLWVRFVIHGGFQQEDQEKSATAIQKAIRRKEAKKFVEEKRAVIQQVRLCIDTTAF